MIDLTKLTPAPWRSERRYSNECEIVPRIHSARSKDRECGWVADLVGAPYLGYESTLVNAEFIALARNAFDVMMRRGWYPAKVNWHAEGVNCWGVVQPSLGNNRMMGTLTSTEPYLWPDPFTALVEADKWYRENVEAKAISPAAAD